MGVNDKQNRHIRKERKRLFRKRERFAVKSEINAVLENRNLTILKNTQKRKHYERLDIYKCYSQESHRKRTTQQLNRKVLYSFPSKYSCDIL